MKRCKLLLVVMAVCCLFPAAGDAQDVFFRNGRAEILVQNCKAVAAVNLEKMVAPGNRMSDIGRCLGFMEGVIDASALLHANDPKAVIYFCVPQTASGAELAKVIVKYGEDHPEQLHIPGAIFVTNSLSVAFPC